MKNTAIVIQVAQYQLFWGHRKMAETIDFLSVRAALGWIDFQIVEIGTASARKEEACRMVFELEMLHVVIVAS